MGLKIDRVLEQIENTVLGCLDKISASPLHSMQGTFKNLEQEVVSVTRRTTPVVIRIDPEKVVLSQKNGVIRWEWITYDGGRFWYSRYYVDDCLQAVSDGITVAEAAQAFL